MPHEIMGITTCNLPHPKKPGEACGAKFVGPQHLVIGVHNGQGGHMAALFEKLIRHLVDVHPLHMQQIIMQGEEYKGMLYMLAFESADREFHEQRNYFRWSVHQRTLGARFTDKKLGDFIEATATAAADEIVADGLVLTIEEESTERARVKQSLLKYFAPEIREMRDALQEPVEPTNPLAPKLATQ